eukprot:s308_g57.t1
METVQRCKRTLEAAGSVEQLKAALEERSGRWRQGQELRNLGELSTKVLAETKIGLAVNQLSKASHGSEEVRDMAKCLLQDWKQKGVAESESPKKAARGAPVVPEPPKKVTGARLKVLEKLQDALKEASLRCGSKAVSELHQKFTDMEQAEKLYMNQSRSILFNLKDPKNQTFAAKLLAGELSPSQLPSMSSEAGHFMRDLQGIPTSCSSGPVIGSRLNVLEKLQDASKAQLLQVLKRSPGYVGRTASTVCGTQNVSNITCHAINAGLGILEQFAQITMISDVIGHVPCQGFSGIRSLKDRRIVWQSNAIKQGPQLPNNTDQRACAFHQEKASGFT